MNNLLNIAFCYVLPVFIIILIYLFFIRFIIIPTSLSCLNGYLSNFKDKVWLLKHTKHLSQNEYEFLNNEIEEISPKLKYFSILIAIKILPSLEKNDSYEKEVESTIKSQQAKDCYRELSQITTLAFAINSRLLMSLAIPYLTILCLKAFINKQLNIKTYIFNKVEAYNKRFNIPVKASTESINNVCHC